MQLLPLIRERPRDKRGNLERESLERAFVHFQKENHLNINTKPKEILKHRKSQFMIPFL